MLINLRQTLSASKPALARNALLGLYASGAHLLAPAAMRGLGAIFMLHRVREPDDTEFAPNRILEITPAYLDALLTHVQSRGLICLSLDEAVKRIAAGDTSERFVVFTLDDGYKDNLDVAAPIFARHSAPFTVYLATSLPDGTAELWWVVLERLIASANELRVRFGEAEETFTSRTVPEKKAAWDAIYWRLRALGEPALRAEVRRLAQVYGLDIAAITHDLAMSWDELRALAAHPYASIEAHTASHIALAQISGDEARADIAAGLARHEAELGRRPQHFSYPYGDPTSADTRDFEIAASFDFRSATTTRKGLIRPEHAKALTRLPRLSLNGDYQDLRILDVLLSGLPFSMAKALGSASID
ncbi:MAG: polysaccharide deacetylase family protein [Parvibaculaceae bacterium]